MRLSLKFVVLEKVNQHVQHLFPMWAKMPITDFLVPHTCEIIFRDVIGRSTVCLHRNVILQKKKIQNVAD